MATRENEQANLSVHSRACASADRVLVVTGGLITSQETSVWQAFRKCLAQYRHAHQPWLDVKVKLEMAEPLLAKVVENWQLPLRSRSLRNAVRAYFRPSVELSSPPLTEVVIATLLAQENIAYETLGLDELFANSSKARQKLDACSCVFLSTTFLHDLSELGAIVRRLKRPGNRIVVGGALVGVLARSWSGLPEIDLVAVGYGERLIPPIADWMRGGYRVLEPPEGGRVERRTHSTFLFSGVPATRVLDSLPRPDWSRSQRDHGRRFRMIYYESVRGCPYRCRFCNYPFLFDDHAFRYKTATRMADDWAHYVDELGVEYIICLDSLFTMPRERLHDFCDQLIRRGIRVRWVCYARADDLADEETVARMKAAGACQVQIGLESADPVLLRNMNKHCTVEANRQAVRNCRQHGLTSVVSLIVGYPGETAESLERTYEFLSQTPPDFYFLATFSARIPGVPLLQPENRARFGLRVAENRYSMAPYWRHDTMCCGDVGNHVRRMDNKLMANRVALNATLFYHGMLQYQPHQRQLLLDFQRRIATRHPLLRAAFHLANRWVDRRLRRDVRRQLSLRDASDLQLLEEGM